MNERGTIKVDTDGGIRTIDGVADVAEMVPGKLQVVYGPDDREIVEGRIFGGDGDWKAWLGEDKERREVRDIITEPNDNLCWWEGRQKMKGAGGIKRLKQPNL